MLDQDIVPELHRRWRTPRFDEISTFNWTSGFSVICFGVRIGVRADDPGLLEHLCELVPADAKPYRGAVVDHYFSALSGRHAEGTQAGGLGLLYQNDTQLYRGDDPERLMDTFAAHVRLGVAALAPRHTFVHAGVVGWQGRAILLPGRTLAGKTTLTAALARAGACYFSDEYAVLDAEGWVHPFRKPLSLRAHPTARQVDTPVEALGGHAARDPLPVGLVVLSTYKAGARWRPQTLTPGQGALAILENTVNARFAPERVMANVQKVVARAVVVKSSRGEAAEAAAAILRMVERRCRL